MLGRITARFDRCLTDESGAVVLSFASDGSESVSARKCADAIRKAVEKGKERFSVEVSIYSEKRSRDANAYLWVLCDKISKKLKTTKEEVYRKYIKETGIYRENKMNQDFAKTMRTAWERLGVGWVTEQVDFSGNGENVVVRFYYGSSTYNKRQMTRLIESVIEDCEELGIETITPEEKENLLNLWAQEKGERK